MQAAGPAKSNRIDLGLALLSRVAMPGICYSRGEIATWCGCTENAIYLIEKKALRKLRSRWLFLKDARLRELIEGLFDAREAAQQKEAA